MIVHLKCPANFFIQFPSCDPHLNINILTKFWHIFSDFYIYVYILLYICRSIISSDIAPGKSSGIWHAGNYSWHQLWNVINLTFDLANLMRHILRHLAGNWMQHIFWPIFWPVSTRTSLPAGYETLQASPSQMEGCPTNSLPSADHFRWFQLTKVFVKHAWLSI